MKVVDSKYRGTREYARVYSELITAAKYRGTVRFMEIARILGITKPGGYLAAQVGQVLGEISEDEVACGRPMLSAIAVSAQGETSPGFYKFAQELGLLASEGDQKEFWKKECQKVYDCWKVEV